MPYSKDMNKSNNPYVNTLVEMGYDRQDCEMVAAAGQSKKFPCVIYGRTFESQEQYDQELHDYLNGLWQSPRWHQVTRQSTSHPVQ